jgi:hypothetical protein
LLKLTKVVEQDLKRQRELVGLVAAAGVQGILSKESPVVARGSASCVLYTLQGVVEVYK